MKLLKADSEKFPWSNYQVYSIGMWISSMLSAPIGITYIHNYQAKELHNTCQTLTFGFLSPTCIHPKISIQHVPGKMISHIMISGMNISLFASSQKQFHQKLSKADSEKFLSQERNLPPPALPPPSKHIPPQPPPPPPL